MGGGIAANVRLSYTVMVWKALPYTIVLFALPLACNIWIVPNLYSSTSIFFFRAEQATSRLGKDR
ncbi:hypothetical protein EBR25_13395 [bacterium]|nr:hypothetical protein [bacterium]